MRIISDYNSSGIFDYSKKVKLRFIEIEDKYREAKKIYRDGCPACGESRFEYAFPKKGFHYVFCVNCSTLYILDPVDRENYQHYLSDVTKDIYESKIYNEYMKEVAGPIGYDLEMAINRFYEDALPGEKGYAGINNTALFQEINSQETTRNYIMIEDSTSDLFDFIVLNNTIESQLHLREYITAITHRLRPGGIIYVTARLGSGFDVLTLLDNAMLIPLQHLNLLTIEGIRELFNTDYTVLELSTPGSFDLKNIQNTETPLLSRFMKYILKYRKDDTMNDFQDFIQKNLLSSYLVMIARRNG